MVKTLISIVICAYNEQDNILPMYEALERALNGNQQQYAFEYIYVNDGSTDATLVRLQDLMLRDPKVKTVHFMRNFGHEIALSAGIDYAAGEAVVVMDGDLQHPPALIPQMISAWEQGSDVVITKRQEVVGQSKIRQYIGDMYYKILNNFSDFPIVRSAPDFRLLARNKVEILKRMPERNRVMRGLVAWLGSDKVQIIDFVAGERLAGESKYSARKLFSLAYESIIAFSVKPLRFALYLGLFSALVSLFVGGYHIVEYFVLHRPSTGFATLLAAITFLGAVQLLVLGIMGEYIAKIHLEVKGRPLYVAELLTNDKGTIVRNH